MDLFKKFFKSKRSENNLTTISRTQVIDGFSIPGIIRNGAYHFTDLQVYKDGLIYCWDMVDFDLFQKKLKENWVVTSIPDGEAISIFSLGRWTVQNGEWLYDKQGFYAYIQSLVQRLNPRMENLYNCHGKTSEKINGVYVSIFGSVQPNAYYISKAHNVFPERTDGKKFYIFFREEDNRLFLSELSIYPNDHVEITHVPQKIAFKFSTLRTLIDEKRIISEVPIGEKVHIHGLGAFTTSDGRGVDIESKYQEFINVYQVLNGQEDLVDKCRKIFDEYMQQPTVKARTSLKEAYEAIPKHQRMYVGDMDSKDFIVRYVIYGDNAKKEWEERYGSAFPYIDTPKPADEK